MPGIPFWKILTVLTIVLNWAGQALQNGKITLTEALELVQLLATALGVQTLFDIPPDDPQPKGG